MILSIDLISLSSELVSIEIKPNGKDQKHALTSPLTWRIELPGRLIVKFDTFPHFLSFADVTKSFIR